MRNSFAYIFTAALLLAACSGFKDEKVSLEEVGLLQNSYTVEYEAGIIEIPVIANGPSTVTSLDGASWAKFRSYTFSEDGKLQMQYESNVGFPRMAKFLLSLDSNPRYAKDTLTILQKGLVEPYLSFPRSNVLIYNGSGNTSVPISTNVPSDNLRIRERILDGDEDWIESVSLSGGNVEIATTDNTGSDKRTAAITFSYDSGWGQTVAVDLHLTQLSGSNDMGVEADWGDLRSLATADGYTVGENIYITGYVVSSKESCNVTENPMTSTSTIDYTATLKSAVLESTDGKYGFMLQTMSEEDNIFEENALVHLQLQGRSIKVEQNPARYSIVGIKSGDVLTSEIVDESLIPEKRRHISELTDDDIYTRVLLTDMEYPVRKGSLSPCFERMTNAANNDAATKFATLLRDREGLSIYTYTNTTCRYRRDGTRMGYGSGEVRGIIVHEKHRPFIDQDGATEEECGNIGRYQIRHQSRSDFRLADDFHDGFSEMICEFRYAAAADGRIQATYGSGSMNHTGPTYKEYTFGYTGQSYYDYSYLGPVGTNDSYYFGKHYGNENGFGIILEDGTDYGLDFTGTNADVYSAGRTPRTAPCNLAWAAYYWWDSVTGTPYFWDLHFSTKGIVTDVLSLQLSMLNEVQAGKAPRYWKIEWAETAAYSETADWQLIGEFDLPDLTPTSHTLLPSMSAAFKPMDFPLPLEMLGKESVHIRIGPRNNKASDLLGYANTTVANGLGGGAMNYCAVRYNK